MEHFSHDVVGKPVVDAHGVHIGTVAGIEDGNARLKGETSLASQMEEGLSPEGTEGLAIAPEQVAEVTDEHVRVSLELDSEF